MSYVQKRPHNEFYLATVNGKVLLCLINYDVLKVKYMDLVYAL